MQPRISYQAITNGNIECFRYIVEHGGKVQWNEVCKWLDQNIRKTVFGKHDWLAQTVLNHPEVQQYPRLHDMFIKHKEAVDIQRKYIFDTLSNICCVDIAKMFVDKFMCVKILK